MFSPVGPKVDFPALERQMLEQWEREGTVGKYLVRNEGSDKRFSFIDGPITANNPMGVHHAWGRTYKDLFQRYKTMQGYRQRYQNGFDGQGLWIEVEVEKELGLNSKRDIETVGIDKFVELCKERVRRFADVQTQQSIRLGYWMDWDNSYHTMSDENNYTIWHFLKVCHERGWIYEGTDVMPWCPRCGTGLSQHEIVTEGYREIVHPGLFVRFPLLERPDEALLVWTTTPWTLTSNTGVYVKPDLTYARVRTTDGALLYLLKGRLQELHMEHEVLEEMPGSALVGLRYRGPFDELPAQKGVDHRVVPWDEVSESEGTGVVHTAPGAGAEDFKISKREGLSVIAPLDEFGVFVDGFDWLTGKHVYETNEAIYDSLRQKGLLFRLEDYTHRYPVCWRCDSELVYRLVDEWFISMDELRELIAGVTRKIQWIPEFGLQRELDWLRNMDDWMISKKRYWGLALPIYKCDCGHFEVIGGEAELRERAVEGWEGFEGHSPHRPWVDAVKVRCSQCGEKVSRILDVGNPWLDAGIVPYSTLDYQQDRDHWSQWFPADWISESFPGQFRNWFYSLLTMSTVLENTEPFRSIFSYALVRDESGEEMHKSKGNAIEFGEAAEKMGVDSMRWLYARHNPAANLNFGFDTGDEVRRRFIIPLWNVYSFFVTYANIDKYDPRTAAPPPVESRPELDRWVLSELNRLIADVVAALDGYEPDSASRAVEDFVEHLSNWYVRRSRRRFWKSGVLGEGGDEDKLAAYATLYECLVTLAKLLAPFIPFVTEAMYQNLSDPLKTGLVRSADGGAESVHLESYPEADLTLVDQRLSEATRLAIRLSSLGRGARTKAGLKVRQPVQEIAVRLHTSADAELLTDVESQVKEELNVKVLRVLDGESELAAYLDYQVQPNHALLGPKYGADLPKIVSALSSADAYQVHKAIQSGERVQVGAFDLEPEEVVATTSDKPDYSSNSDGQITVVMSKRISPELALEGLARELVHRIQNMRRSAGFDITDYITTYYQGPARMEEVVVSHGDYISQETLSRGLESGPPAEGAYVEEQVIDGLEVVLGVKRG